MPINSGWGEPALRPDPAFWKDRTVCVTGGTGFLGYHLVNTLVDAGARVRVFALNPAENHPLRKIARAEIISGDVLDAAAVKQAIAGCSIVMHAAGIVSVWGPAVEKMWAVHVEGTRNVLSALDPAARMIHTSSIVAVGASKKPVAFDEASVFNLDRIQVEYVRSKRAAEEVALASDGDVVVVNPGYLIGPEDFERSVMGQLCHRFWRGRAPLAPPGGLCFVDVRDVAIGHLLAAERGTRGKRYILGGENLSYPEFFRILAEVAGMRPRYIPRISSMLFTAGSAMNELRGRMRGKEPYPSLAHARMNRYFWYYASDRAQREFGYEPRSVRDSLADAYAWYSARETFRIRGFNRWLLRPTCPQAREDSPQGISAA